MKIKKRSLESIGVFFILIRSTTALMPLLRKETIEYINPVTINYIDLVVSVGLSFIALFLFLSQTKACLKALIKNRLIGLLLGLVFISIFWSNQPEFTFRQSIFLLGTTLFGVYLAVRFDRKEILRLLLWTIATSALLSIIFAIEIPYLGLHSDDHQQAWRGIYLHKNTLGRLMVLGVICALVLAMNSKKKKSLAPWVFIGVFLSIVFLAKSTTAIVMLFALLLILPIFRIIHLNIVIVLPCIILIILSFSLLLTWLLVNIDSVFLFLGKDITLTGRTILWQAVWDVIKERFWTGYGYGAFWLGNEGPSSYVWEYIQWDTPNAHNGLLELWLQVGIVGVIIFLISLLGNIIRAIFLVRKYPNYINIFPLVFFIFFTFINISESTIMVQNSIYWITYVAFSIQLNNYSKQLEST